MSYDKRTALPNNHTFIITDRNTGNAYALLIEKEIGRGGSCIVYQGIQYGSVGDEPAPRTVVIKEFYPIALDTEITRTDDLDLDIPEGKQAQFANKLKWFCVGQAKHVVFASENTDTVLPPVSASGEAHNTFYAVSDLVKGSTLSREGITLTDAIERSISICEAISQIHQRREMMANGRRISGSSYYLDLKPQNVYICEKNRAFLFDFDTVQARDRIEYCSFSEGWSAPEQELVEGIGYQDEKLIGYHTDIFSIGGCLYFMLTGKKPTKNELKRIQSGIDWRAAISLPDSEGALDDTVFTRELDRIMKEMLEPDPTRRKEFFGNSNAATRAKHDLEHLLQLAQNTPYRKGFADTSAKIDDTKDVLERSIEKHSIQAFLFGSKKRIAITISVLLAAAVLFGALFFAGGKMAETIVGNPETKIEPDFDDHILLKLSNANHQYEVGLENWRRLDYNRAERDICAAQKEIIEHKAQSEMDVARINNSLGCLYLDMGRYREAYDNLNAAYVTFRDTLGEDSVEARAVRASIAQYYYNTGLLEEALAETQYILDHSDETTEQAIIAGTSHLRAMIFDAQGKYDQALLLYQQVLTMYSSIAADGKMCEQLADYANDPKLSQSEKDNYTNAVKWIILTYNNIAMVNNHKGDSQAAIAAANTGLKLSLSNMYIGRRNLTTSKLYMNLAIAQMLSGNTKDALDSIDLAMRIQRNLFDFEDVFPGLVRVYDVYGDILMTQGKTDTARLYYMDAVELAQSSFGENHPDTAAAYDEFARYYLETNHPESALEYLAKSVEVRKNILAENHPDTARIYYDYAMALVATGHSAEAEEYLRKAETICETWNMEGTFLQSIRSALE